jgi:hypothetical protein
MFPCYVCKASFKHKATIVAHLKKHPFCSRCEAHQHNERILRYHLDVCWGTDYPHHPTDMDNLSSAFAAAYPDKCFISDAADDEEEGVGVEPNNNAELVRFITADTLPYVKSTKYFGKKNINLEHVSRLVDTVYNCTREELISCLKKSKYGEQNRGYKKIMSQPIIYLPDDEKLDYWMYPDLTWCLFELQKYIKPCKFPYSTINHLRLKVLARLLYKCHSHHLLKLIEIRQGERKDGIKPFGLKHVQAL